MPKVLKDRVTPRKPRKPSSVFRKGRYAITPNSRAAGDASIAFSRSGKLALYLWLPFILPLQAALIEGELCTGLLLAVAKAVLHYPILCPALIQVMTQDNFLSIVSWIEGNKDNLARKHSAIKIFYASWTGVVPQRSKFPVDLDAGTMRFDYETNAAGKPVDANGDRLWTVRRSPTSSPLTSRLTPGYP